MPQQPYKQPGKAEEEKTIKFVLHYVLFLYKCRRISMLALKNGEIITRFL